MKLKRTVLILIASSIILNIAPVQAAVKAGASCKAAGIKSVASGKTYTCIKTGKKLVWDKGSPVVIVTQPKAPTGFNDLVSNYSGISYAAWKKSSDKINKSPNVPIPLEMIVGEHSKLNNKNPSFAFSQINKLYAGNVFPEKIYFLAFNYQDRDWAVTKMDQLVPNAASSWIRDVACPTAESCIGGGSFHNVSNKTNLIVIGTGIDPNNIENSISGTLEAHEYTHSIQQSSSAAFRPPVNLLKFPWPPNWYWEGLAQFSQHAAIYSDSFNKYSEFRKKSSGNIFNSAFWDAGNIEKYFQVNLTNEWYSQYPRWRQYDLGAMLVEILVAINGPDSAMEVFNQSVNGSGFESAFEKIYGISFQTALPIISKAIALELAR